MLFWTWSQADAYDLSDYMETRLNGTQFVPIGMPTVCRKSCPSNLRCMLSTKNSVILQMSLVVLWSIANSQGQSS